MKNRIIIAAAITACLALCAAVWPQTEKVEKTPAPSETTAVTTPRPTLPEAEKPVLPVVTEKKESEMPEAESAPEVTAEEMSAPTPEIEKQFEAEQKSAPPMQTEPAPVHPTQSESASEPIANDNELADMVYVPGFGWIESQGPNHVEYAEDMYENGNKIGTMG
jgi:type IV secretory pathway VirB10-like protein